MTKKTKQEEQREDNFGAAEEARYAAEQKRYADAERERQTAAREMMLTVGAALLSSEAEQAATSRAERFAHYARALVDLRQMGSFPAIEQLSKAALDELTVLSRELHTTRIAKVSQ